MAQIFRSRIPATLLGAAFALPLVFTTPARAEAVKNDALVALLPQKIKDSRIVTVATPMQNAPNIYTENGEPKGEAVDLLRAIEPILDVTFKFVDIQWPGVIPGVQAGNYDMSAGVMSYRIEREEILDLVPYRSNMSGILLSKDDAGKLEKPADLCGLKVAAVQGAAFIQTLQKETENCQAAGLKAIEVLTYPSTGLAVVALRSGNVKALTLSTAELVYGTRQSDGAIEARFFDAWTGNPQAVATSKENNGLAEAIAGALRQMRENGALEGVLAGYGLDVTVFDAEKIQVNPGRRG